MEWIHGSNRSQEDGFLGQCFRHLLRVWDVISILLQRSPDSLLLSTPVYAQYILPAQVWPPPAHCIHICVLPEDSSASASWGFCFNYLRPLERPCEEGPRKMNQVPIVSCSIENNPHYRRLFSGPGGLPPPWLTRCSVCPTSHSSLEANRSHSQGSKPLWLAADKLISNPNFPPPAAGSLRKPTLSSLPFPQSSGE